MYHDSFTKILGVALAVFMLGFVSYVAYDAYQTERIEVSYCSPSERVKTTYYKDGTVKVCMQVWTEYDYGQQVGDVYVPNTGASFSSVDCGPQFKDMCE